MARHSISHLDSWYGIAVAYVLAAGFNVKYDSADAQLSSDEVFPQSREVQVVHESREVAPHGIADVLSSPWQKTRVSSQVIGVLP